MHLTTNMYHHNQHHHMALLDPSLPPDWVYMAPPLGCQPTSPTPLIQKKPSKSGKYHPLLKPSLVFLKRS